MINIKQNRVAKITKMVTKPLRKTFTYSLTFVGSGPYIVSVEPAMSPRKGTRIVILGENFVPETQVFIENIK